MLPYVQKAFPSKIAWWKPPLIITVSEWVSVSVCVCVCELSLISSVTSSYLQRMPRFHEKSFENYLSQIPYFIKEEIEVKLLN